MRTPYNPNQSPRVIIIQKLYGNFFNDDTDLTFPKHRFKKFIKDIVFGTIERNDLILDELNNHPMHATEKQDLLNMILLYFKLHLQGFMPPKSLSILNQVFN